MKDDQWAFGENSPVFLQSRRLVRAGHPRPSCPPATHTLPGRGLGFHCLPVPLMETSLVPVCKLSSLTPSSLSLNRGAGQTPRKCQRDAFSFWQKWMQLKFTAVPCFSQQVLSMLINAAYKPGRVLRELQLVEDPHWNFQEETLKAK